MTYCGKNGINVRFCSKSTLEVMVKVDFYLKKSNLRLTLLDFKSGKSDRESSTLP